MGGGVGKKGHDASFLFKFLKNSTFNQPSWEYEYITVEFFFKLSSFQRNKYTNYFSEKLAAPQKKWFP